MESFTGLLFLVALIGVSADHQIPAAWGTCRRSQPDVNECLKGAIQRAISQLSAGGNAELGVPTLDPFMVKQFRLSRGGNGPLTLDMTFSDVEIAGLHDSKVQSVETDFNKFELRAMLKAKELNIQGKYKVRGRLLLVPLNGDGRTVIKMDKPSLMVKINGHLEKGSSQKDHLHIDSLTFDVMPEKSNFKFINPAHATETELLSRVVSENDKMIINELRPSISESFSKSFKEIADAVFDKVAFEDVFPQ